MSSFGRQLTALLWKNYILKKRAWLTSLLEALLPIIVISIIGGNKATFDQSYHLEDVGFYQDPPTYLFGTSSNSSSSSTIGYWFNKDNNASVLAFAPYPSAAPVVDAFIKRYPIMQGRILTFAQDSDIDSYVQGPQYGNKPSSPSLLGALIVDTIGSPSNPSWSYTIRLSAQIPADTPSGSDVNVLRNTYDGADANLIWNHGHIFLQNFMENYILSVTSGIQMASIQRNFSHVPFPTPSYVDSGTASAGLIAFVFILVYSWPLMRFVRSVVYEKETRIKEGMKMMGLSESALFLSWYITYILLFFLSAFFIMVGTGSQFPHSDKGRVLAFFWLFGWSIISYGYLVSVFFSKASTASTTSAILFLGQYFIYYVVTDASPSSKKAASLLPPVAFALGLDTLSNWELTGPGVVSDTAGTDINGYSYNTCIGMIFLDFFLYGLLSIYLSLVIRNEWGTSLPWYFPFVPSYWRETLGLNREEDLLRRASSQEQLSSSLAANKNQHHYISVEGNKEMHVSNEFFEPVSRDISGKLAVSIQNLTKNFTVDSADAPQIAVDHLNLNLYDGQILSLLGHNGAGKTTTINMLTGMIPATSGDALMYNLSLNKDLSAIRKILGVCPQHNILWDSLTVTEHLKLFCHIKGVEKKEIQRHVNEMIEQVGLVEKKDDKSSALSGGMQRKLSVAIALLGDSKVVFLDEPTSGMDPYSRRSTWDLLQKKKEGRVMILTTHFMDEADQLGDRIAIMAKGKLQCCGSSLFLKSKYGVGYTCTIVKQPHFKFDNVSELMKECVPSHQLLSNIAGEISYRLPFDESHRFPRLFNTFDSQKDKLGIEAYGISITTLEEVFLRVGTDQSVHPLERAQTKREIVKRQSLSNVKRENVNLDDSIPIEIMNEQKREPLANGEDDEAILKKTVLDRNAVGLSFLVFWRQTKALLIKRWHNAKRDKRAMLWTILYPILILLLMGALVNKAISIKSSTLTLAQYNQPLPTPYLLSNSSSSNSTFSLFSSILPTNPQFSIQSFDPYPIPPSSLSQFTPSKFNALLQSSKPLNQMYQSLTPAQQADLFIAAQVDDYLNNSLTSLTDPPDTYFHGQLAYSRYIAYFSDFLQVTYNTTTNKPESISDHFMLFHNTTSLYSIPIALNTYNQRLLQKLTNNDNANIKLSTRSLPATAQTQLLSNTAPLFLICIAFSFIPASFVGYVVYEIQEKFKHQQLISGVSIVSYWFSCFIWDFANFLIPGFISLMIFAIYGLSQLIGSNASASVLAVLLFGLSVIPFSYVFTFRFTDSTEAQNYMLKLYIFTGTFLVVFIFILSIFLTTVGHYIRFVFRVFPSFCFGEVMLNMFTRTQGTLFWKYPRDLYDMEITGYPMLYMFVEIWVYWGLVFMIEYVQRRPSCLKMFSSQGKDVEKRVFENEDEDVTNERNRLIDANPPDMITNKDVISIRGLRKVYNNGKESAKVAVHDLWLSIPQGQCYGYLGINGAGKTTTLKMLSGDILPTRGTAYLNGYDIINEQGKIRRFMGYCPQFDALMGSLTAREHLYLFARIKGVDEAFIPRYVDVLLRKIGLQEGQADKPCKGYSGGNKRKLCVGIALVGNPPVVFLDEPSTGVDPGARRQLWDLISSTMAGRSVILTTHSMEECEALCQSLGIMVGGRLRCTGSLTHLKQKYGDGYQIDASLLEPSADHDYVSAFQAFLERTFPGVKLIEHHGNHVKYRVPRILSGASEMHVSIGMLFSRLESNKAQLGIQNYSVAETSLEQIFISFAKQQEEETGVVAGLE